MRSAGGLPRVPQSPGTDCTATTSPGCPQMGAAACRGRWWGCPVCGGGVQGAGQGHPSPRESRAAAGVPGAGGLGEGPAGAGTQHQVLSPGSACAQGCHVNSRPVSGGAGPRAKETDPTLCSEPGPGRAPCPRAAGGARLLRVLGWALLGTQVRVRATCNLGQGLVASALCLTAWPPWARPQGLA